MIFLQHFIVYPRFIIISLSKSSGYDLHQILIALIILCKQNKMIISVLSSCLFSIKSRTRCHINLTSKYRFYPYFFCFFIKINHTIHDSMICNSDAIHSKFFCSWQKLFNLTRSIQQTVFRMHM